MLDAVSATRDCKKMASSFAYCLAFRVLDLEAGKRWLAMNKWNALMVKPHYFPKLILWASCSKRVEEHIPLMSFKDDHGG